MRDILIWPTGSWHPYLNCTLPALWNWCRNFRPVELLVPENEILGIKGAIGSWSPFQDQSLLNILIIPSLKIRLFFQAHIY
jgi:hypothetical protein